MRAFGHQRLALTASLAAATLTFACPSTALELHVAAWNLEHLADSNAEGCVGREDADYSALAERIHALGADVVAFQEVENAAAGRRVFDEERWSAEVSTRPSTGSGPPCRGRPSARLGHLATGIAVRAGLEYTRNADFSAVAGGNRFLRWGTDVTVMRGGEDLRVLSVHLNSGCWGAEQDDNASSAATCATLREQMETLAEWIADRREEGTPFVIAGDFNRRLAVPGDWGWVLLSENNPGLSLVTAGRISRCDARYPEYIDHVLFDADTGASMALGSFEEAERSTPHPDHCAVSARFRVAPPDAPLTVPFLVAASGTPPWGFVRVVNRSDEAGTVDIAAIDDTGERFGPCHALARRPCGRHFRLARPRGGRGAPRAFGGRRRWDRALAPGTRHGHRHRRARVCAEPREFSQPHRRDGRRNRRQRISLRRALLQSGDQHGQAERASAGEPGRCDRRRHHQSAR